MASFISRDNSGRARLNGLVLVEGTSSDRSGLATLVSGTLTVATTAATSTCRIFLSRMTLRGTPLELSVSVNAGVGFTINTGTIASPGTETSDIAWFITDVI